MLELLHADVVDFDLLVGRGDADAGAARVEGQVGAVAFGLVKRADGVTRPLIKNADAFVVGARGHQSTVGRVSEKKRDN